MNMIPPTLTYSPPTNRSAQISFLCAILTLFSFCIAVAPIPLTGFVCYPAAVLLGALAILYGIRGARQIRTSGEGGKWLAVFGIVSGALTILVILFITTLIITFLFYGFSSIHNILPQYQGPSL